MVERRRGAAAEPVSPDDLMQAIKKLKVTNLIALRLISCVVQLRTSWYEHGGS